MNSIQNIGRYPAGRPLVSDNILEFHAARLILLLHCCGVKGRIDGLTKLAKLDFFVRYPKFFERACEALGAPSLQVLADVESVMVRHHYGPWDHRYYHVLAYIESRDLVIVSREGARAYRFQLTVTGKQVAERLAEVPSFQEMGALMARVRGVLGKQSGMALKELIYRLFEREVAARNLGEVISQ